MGLACRKWRAEPGGPRFEIADRKVESTEADLEEIVAEARGGRGAPSSIVSLELRGGTRRCQRSVVLADGETGEKIDAAGSSNGMIDAAVGAISRRPV